MRMVVQKSLLLVAVCVPALILCNPIREKRADDPAALETVVIAQGETIEQLEARLTSVEARLGKQETRVAFNVRFSILTGHPVAEHETLAFDLVDVNEGDGYDSQTGIFTAPVSGLYLFSLKITHTPPGSLHVIMMKSQPNTQIAEVEAAGDDSLDRSATVVVTQLHKGQRVWNMKSGGNAAGVEGTWRSSFTGILIRPDTQ